MIPTPVLTGGATGATGSVAAKPLPEEGFALRALVLLVRSTRCVSCRG